MKDACFFPRWIFRWFFLFLFGCVALLTVCTGSTSAAFDMCADADMTVFEPSPHVESWYDLKRTVNCLVTNGIDGNESKTLSSTLDAILDALLRRKKDLLGWELGAIAMEIARALELHGDATGFERINNFFAIADWHDREVQSFFDAVSAHDFKKEFKEVSLDALYRIPVVSGEIGRACQTFNRGSGEAELDDPRYLRGVLHALHRLREVTESLEEWPNKPCRETLLTQILDRPMRETFEKTYLETLAPGERAIYGEYLARITQGKKDADVIDALVKVFLETDWRVPYQRWVNENASYECMRYRGGTWVTDTGEQWCYSCEKSMQDVRVMVYFYLDNRLQECTLQGLRFSVEHAGEGMARDIARRLERHIGVPAPAREIHRRGSAYWEDMTFWDWDDREVIVFKNKSASKFGHGMPLVEILAEEHAVRKAVERYRLEEDKIKAEVKNRNNELFFQMLDDAVKRYPQLVDRIREAKDVESHYSALKTLLQSLQEGEDDVLFLMLVEEYTERFLRSELSFYNDLLKEPEKWNQRKQELKVMGLSVEYDQGGHLFYGNDFLQRALALNATGYWAEVALLKEIRSSCWSNMNPADDDKNMFTAIEKAESLLNSGADKRIMTQLLYSLAEIHETGWSLSHASDDDEAVDFRRYLQYMDMHQKRAIDLYKRFLDVCPTCPEVEIVKWRLKRLIMDIDTSARHNFCFVC